jgi:hypothetical protein
LLQSLNITHPVVVATTTLGQLKRKKEGRVM